MTSRGHLPATSFQIRNAEISDVSTILELIRSLAEYEKLQSMVVSSEKDMRNALFGEKRYAEVILAEQHGKTIGFALFFHNFSTFLGKPGICLEDLFVRPESRGRGAGKTLLQTVVNIARKKKFVRVEWAVLDWNELAKEFYRKSGAKELDEWSVFRIVL